MKKSAVLLIALTFVAGACSGGDDTNKVAPVASAVPSTVAVGVTATVTPIDAGVSVKSGAGEFQPITGPTDLQSGDLVRTDDTGFAEVNYPDGSVTRLDVNTEFEVMSITDNAGVATTRANLNGGRVWSRVNDLGTEGEFSVDTSVGVATVRGTAFMVECNDAGDECDFTVLEGEVGVDPPTLPVVVLDGPHTTTVTPDSATEPRVVPFDEAFSDPWVLENANLDAARGFESPAQMYAAYGALLGSLSGQYDGTSKIITTEECATPANCTVTAGSWLFTYVFGLECEATFTCSRFVDLQYDLGGVPTQARADLTMVDGRYTWELDVLDPACNATEPTNIVWKMLPISAARKDGRWVITKVKIETTVTPPADCAKPPSGGGGTAGPPTTQAPTASNCSTWPLTSINAMRAEVGQPPLSEMGNGQACAWALQMAANGSLGHGNTQCGYQVVGYVGSTGGAVNPNAPEGIINGWYNSRGGPGQPPKHYEILTYPAVTKIGLAFVTVVNGDGSWRVYGVGNLC